MNSTFRRERALAGLPLRFPGNPLLDCRLDDLEAPPGDAGDVLLLGAALAGEVTLGEFLASFALPGGSSLALPPTALDALHAALVHTLALHQAEPGAGEAGGEASTSPPRVGEQLALAVGEPAPSAALARQVEARETATSSASPFGEAAPAASFEPAVGESTRAASIAPEFGSAAASSSSEPVGDEPSGPAVTTSSEPVGDEPSGLAATTSSEPVGDEPSEAAASTSSKQGGAEPAAAAAIVRPVDAVASPAPMLEAAEAAAPATRTAPVAAELPDTPPRPAAPPTRSAHVPAELPDAPPLAAATDPASSPYLEALPPPPSADEPPFPSVVEAQNFARAAGIEDVLSERIAPLLGVLPPSTRRMASYRLNRLLDAFLDESWYPERAAAGFARLRHAASLRLRLAAHEQLVLARRLQLTLAAPRRAASPALQPLLERLLDARRERAVLLPIVEPVDLFSEAFEDAGTTLVLASKLEFPDEPWRNFTSRARFALEEDGRPTVRCFDCPKPCRHEASFLDTLIGALVAGDGLADAVAEQLVTPRWERELHGVLSALEPPKERVAFVVEVEPSGEVRVQAVREKLDRSGRWTDRGRVRTKDLRRGLGATPREERAIVALDESKATYVPAEVRPVMRTLAMHDLVGHPHVRTADGRSVQVVACDARLRAEPRGEGVVLSPWGDRLPLPPALVAQAWQRRSPFVVAYSSELARVEVAELSQAVALAAPWAGERPLSFPPEAAAALLAASTRGLRVELPASMLGAERPVEQTVVLVLAMGEGAALTVKVRVRPAPAGAELLAGEGPALSPGSHEGARCCVRRDLAQERARVAEVIAALQLRVAAEREPGTFVLDEGEEGLTLLARLSGGLPPEVVVRWEGTPRRLLAPIEEEALAIRISSAGDWFAMDGQAVVDGGTLELARLLAAARQGRRFVELPSGSFAELGASLRAQLVALADRVHVTRAGLEVPLVAAEALATICGDRLEAPPAFHGLVSKIRAAAQLDPEVPAALTATLRPYQREGFRWLTRLASWGAGGVLADDMGLGKTVQSLALLLERASLGPQLVVAPTSVVGNWAAEAARFAPSLRIVVFGALPPGERAAALGAAGPGTLLLCSWGVLVRELPMLEGAQFATLLFDEAQAGKNAQSLRAKAARSLRADARFALTGTPVENHLGELHAVFGLAVPGVLGSRDSFRTRFALPLERGDDPARREALVQLVRPFLLRRRKQEVAPELPAKTEMIVEVSLSQPERQLYEEARLAAVAELQALAPTAGLEQRRFQVLAAITRLRLCACHPKLYAPELELPASKLARAIELLVELRDEGHRALVFSQFTRHLDLVEPALVAAGLRALRLDGSTPAAERSRLVARFQAGEGDLFLISLKAGGTGLNLTGADFVLHLDPWWNPAVEDQATDRAHRLGQTRPVTVLRLVSRGTIEEPIVAMHGRKRALVEGVLGGSDGAAQLDADELTALLLEGASAVQEA